MDVFIKQAKQKDKLKKKNSNNNRASISSEFVGPLDDCRNGGVFLHQIAQVGIS